MRNKFLLFILYGLFSTSFSQSVLELMINKNDLKDQKIKSELSNFIELEKNPYGDIDQPYFKKITNEKLEKNIRNLLSIVPTGKTNQILITKAKYDEDLVVKSAAEAAGHSVTLVPATAEDDFPDDVSGYDQIWMMDILDGSLLETEKAKLKTVLENGGTVAFIAVSCSPCQDRLDSYESFIAEVGGGDLSISSGSSPTADMIVQSNFRQPNNITEAYFKWSRYCLLYTSPSPRDS